MTALPLLLKPWRFKYHVLFSYASDDADYVHAVRGALPKKIKVFDYSDGEKWGQVLEEVIERTYEDEAPFCVVFISAEYLDKKWTKTELDIVARVNERKPGYMLPVMLEAMPPPHQIEKFIWLDKRFSSKQLAESIVAQFQKPPRKPWWFYTTEFKAAAALVLLLAIYWIWPSRTSIASFGTDTNGQAITAHIANWSPKLSTVEGQRLKFDKLPIYDAELQLDAESKRILPGEHSVTLTLTTIEPKCGVDGNRPNNDAVAALLDRHDVTLEIDVRESDGAPGRLRTRIPAASLEPFIRKWVPHRVPPC